MGAGEGGGVNLSVVSRLLLPHTQTQVDAQTQKKTWREVFFVLSFRKHTVPPCCSQMIQGGLVTSVCSPPVFLPSMHYSLGPVGPFCDPLLRERVREREREREKQNGGEDKC